MGGHEANACHSAPSSRVLRTREWGLITIVWVLCVSSIAASPGAAQGPRVRHSIAEINSGLAGGMISGRWVKLLESGACVVGGERLQARDAARLRQLGATDELLRAIRESACPVQNSPSSGRALEASVSAAISRADFAGAARLVSGASRGASLDDYTSRVELLRKVQDACVAFRRVAGVPSSRCPRDP